MNLSKKHILEFFGRQEGAISFAALVREFGGRRAKLELKNMLEDMAEDGEIIRLKGNNYSRPGKMKAIRGRISVHRDGYGFVTPEGGGEDIFIPSKFLRGTLHGDLVEASSSPSRMGGNKLDGRMLTALEPREGARGTEQGPALCGRVKKMLEKKTAEREGLARMHGRLARLHNKLSPAASPPVTEGSTV